MWQTNTTYVPDSVHCGPENQDYSPMNRQDWLKDSVLLDIEYAHKKIAKDVPKVVSLLSMWWCLSTLYAIGPRRILRYIQNTAHVVLNLIITVLLLKVILRIFNVNVVN